MQFQLLAFLVRVGECYRKDKRASNFLYDLFCLEVPRLFDKEVQQHDMGVEDNVADRFMEFLKAYVKKNNLHSSLIDLFHSLVSISLVSISDRQEHDFQRLIYSVLQSVCVQSTALNLLLKHVFPSFSSFAGDNS